jgi:hypothetical protein
MATVWIRDEIHARLRRLAEHKGLSIHRLATLYIEMAVSYEETQGRAEAVAILEAVLSRLVRERWQSTGISGGTDELPGVQPAALENPDA